MLQQLLDVLALEPLGEDRFLGHNMHPRGFRIYGGQVLAQALSAAQQTVSPDRAVHSQHAYFLRGRACAGRGQFQLPARGGTPGGAAHTGQFDLLPDS